jgi:hypothetical protein
VYIWGICVFVDICLYLSCASFSLEAPVVRVCFNYAVQSFFGAPMPLAFFLQYVNNIISAGSAIGFRLDSLLKLTDTRARNKKTTLMHYLCKVEYFSF